MLNEDERKLFLKTRERIWKHVEKMDYNEFVSECLDEAQLVQLFDSSKANVSEHIKHIYEDGELDTGSTVRNSEQFKQRAGEKNHSIKKEYRG